MFQRDFLWGVSMSGFQFEMGDPEEKHLDPNTDWFKWVHDTQNIQKKVVSGDLPESGVNYWELYEADHDLAKGLGMNAYRLGIEWSRIFPENTAGVEVDVDIASDGGVARVDLDQDDLQRLESLANAEALGHYEMVIEDLRDKGLKVIVCLNHFTLPLWLHDPIIARDSKLRRGPRGWYDRETVVEFAKYAAFLAWKLGSKVDMWATFNEPMVVAETGYLVGVGGFPPGIKNDVKAFRIIASNMAVAHARAFDAIKKFDSNRSDLNSPEPAWVGIIHNVFPAIPRDASRKKDLQAVQFMDHMHNTFFVEAAASGWLDINFNGVKEDDEVKDYLGDRMDWLGVNYYTRIMISGKMSLLARIFAGIPVLPEIVPGYGFACKRNNHSLDGRPTSDFGWELYPEGIAQALTQMSKYNRPMYVTENGTADAKDELRPRYILEHLRRIEDLVEEKQVDLRGYLHWALTDNYEWAEGFRMRFGLFDVDLKTKRRVPRGSVEVLRRIIESGTTQGIQV
ncbi:MAG: beta-galactosidase BgaS [Aigarchaeota archaeon]|nr:beta-galactosidase BgaS [Aigarchaeota archaeon]